MFIIFNNQTTFPIDKFDEKNKGSLKSESFSTILEWWHVNWEMRNLKWKDHLLSFKQDAMFTILCYADMILFLFTYI